MSILPATRPIDVHGCFQTWSEKDETNLIRTKMDNGIPKVRRRTTGIYRTANATVVLEKDDYPKWISWFRLDMQQGARPSFFIEPDGTESVWRVVEPPVVEWGAITLEGALAVKMTFKLERLPGWA